MTKPPGTGSRRRDVPRRDLKRFYISFALSAFFATILIIVFTMFVNPFGVSPLQTEIHGLNIRKPARETSCRLVKAYDLMYERNRYDAVITGSSRVAWGFNPDQYEEFTGKRLFNGGIPGSVTEEQYYYILSWLNQCPSIRTVLVELNFDLYQRGKRPTKDFLMDRLGRDFFTYDDFVFLFFSRYAIKSCIETYSFNNPSVKPHTRRYDTGNGQHHPIPRTRELNRRSFEGFLSRQSPGTFILGDDQLQWLERIVNICQERDVELVLFMPPIHAWHMEIYHNNKKRWELFEEFKRRVVAMHPFWSFDGYHPIACEPYDKSDNFFDMTHFYPHIGKLLLMCTAGKKPAGLPDLFGVYVTADNVEDYLEKVRSTRAPWLAERPEEAEKVRKQFVKAPTQKKQSKKNGKGDSG